MGSISAYDSAAQSSGGTKGNCRTSHRFRKTTDANPGIRPSAVFLNLREAAFAKGDHTLDVRWNLARSHYASALTPPDDAADREKRAAALRQAIALLDESTDEAKQLSEARELRRLIDEELARLGRK